MILFVTGDLTSVAGDLISVSGTGDGNLTPVIGGSLVSATGTGTLTSATGTAGGNYFCHWHWWW